MTLAELRSKADSIKIGGRVLPANLSVFQEAIFATITQLCSPLNLLIPYRDKDLLTFVGEDDECKNTKWYLRKPIIAKEDSEYIDIDSRLDMAFVYLLAAYVAADSDRVRFEQLAERICVEYACSVDAMGFAKAKEVYGLESFITDVRFDCVGRFYIVDADFVKLVIDCLLCGNVCMDAAKYERLQLYKQYLAGESIRPIEIPNLQALDRAVFLYIMNNLEAFSAYSASDLSRVTTLSCEFEKLANGESVEPWVLEIDKRLALEAKKE